MSAPVPPLPFWLVQRIATAAAAGETGPQAVMYETDAGPVWVAVDRTLLPPQPVVTDTEV